MTDNNQQTPMEHTLYEHLQEFRQRHEIPTIDIKTGIENFYHRLLIDIFLQSTGRCWGGLFEQVSFDFLEECIAVSEVSGVPIPDASLSAMREEAVRRDNPYLACQVEFTRTGQMLERPTYLSEPEPMSPKSEAKLKRKIKCVERKLGKDESLEHFLQTLPKSPEKRRDLIQEQYSKLASEKGYICIPYIGNFLLFFSKAKTIYAATREAPKVEIVKNMYQQMFSEGKFTNYANGLTGLLWLKEVSGAKLNQDTSIEAFKQLINLSFNYQNPAPEFKVLEKVTGLKTKDIVAGNRFLQRQTSRIYRYALLDDNLKKIKDLEEVTGVHASFTPDDYQNIYHHIFDYTGDYMVGLPALCRKYDKWKIKPEDGFFAAFLRKYAEIETPPFLGDWRQHRDML